MHVLLSLGYRPIPGPSPVPLFNFIGDQEESNCVLYILLQLMSFSSLARAVRTEVCADECWLFEPEESQKP